MKRAARTALGLGVLLAAALLALWWLRGSPEIAASAGAAAQAAGNYGFAHPSSPAPGGATVPASTPTAPASEGSAEAPSAPALPASAAEADQRQDAKIGRGLADHDGDGVLVVATPGGSIPSALHLLPGDVMKTFNGQPLSSMDEFVRLYREQGMPGQVTVERAGREVRVHSGR